MKDYWRNVEYQLIAVVWTIVYTAAPLYMWYTDQVNDFAFNWDRVFDAWIMTTMFLILHMVHHFLLMPRLFFKKRHTAYGIALALCMAAFTATTISHSPKHFPHKEKIFMPHKNQSFRHHDKDRFTDKAPHMHKKMLAPPDVARLIIALLMIGIDLGSAAWIHSQKLRQRLLLLEKQSLKQELEHLRYQINPHFFMNTLNNIHVLVDIDQERAKRAIIELSGLMRHSLYNSSESLTPLQNEIKFVRQYISLMELRFGKRVKVDADLSDAPSSDIMIPPLLYATFIENAFKHGISHQSPSYIYINVNVNENENTIHFRCENSRNPLASPTQDGHHGIGLNNVRKRLDLQYGDQYSLLIIDNNPNRFIVDLTLPVKLKIEKLKN